MNGRPSKAIPDLNSSLQHMLQQKEVQVLRKLPGRVLQSILFSEFKARSTSSEGRFDGGIGHGASKRRVCIAFRLRIELVFTTCTAEVE
jgi:hypothetical protein